MNNNNKKLRPRFKKSRFGSILLQNKRFFSQSLVCEESTGNK
jgi:hypothetical protein